MKTLFIIYGVIFVVCVAISAWGIVWMLWTKYPFDEDPTKDNPLAIPVSKENITYAKMNEVYTGIDRTLFNWWKPRPSYWRDILDWFKQVVSR